MQKIAIVARNSPFFYLTNLMLNTCNSYAICDFGKFPDGELWARLSDVTIFGAKKYLAVIIHHLYPNPNKRLMELLLMIDAVARSGASYISVFIPYFCYSRQDRVTRNCHAGSAYLVFDLLKAAGADRILTLDFHSTKALLCNLISISRQAIIVRDLLKEIDRGDKLALVAADSGRKFRVRDVAEELRLDCVTTTITKRRDGNGNVCQVELTDDVSGHVCLLIDDIIASGQTICKAANLLKEKGAKEVLAYVTHPLLLGDAVEKINSSGIDLLFVGNTLGPMEITNSKKIKVVQLLEDAMSDVLHDLTVGVVSD